jgi:hypothetical protein
LKLWKSYKPLPLVGDTATLTATLAATMTSGGQAFLGKGYSLGYSGKNLLKI